MKASSHHNQGLLNRLVTCLSIVNLIGQTRAIAQLWREFLLELRFRHDSTILIPDLAASVKQDASTAAILNPPDLSRCLLHQKIQMLNCCIRKKIDRQSYENAQQDDQQQKSPPDNDDDEEQFYDCDDQLDEEGVPAKSVAPEGRLKKFENLTLLNKPKEPLYVPITQESTPMV